MVRIEKISEDVFQTQVDEIGDTDLESIVKLDDYKINQWGCGDLLRHVIDPALIGQETLCSVDGSGNYIFFTARVTSTIAMLWVPDLSLIARVDHPLCGHFFDDVSGRSPSHLRVYSRDTQSILIIKISDLSIWSVIPVEGTCGLATKYTATYVYFYNPVNQKGYIREYDMWYILVREGEVGAGSGPIGGIYILLIKGYETENGQTYVLFYQLSESDFSVIKICKREPVSSANIEGLGGRWRFYVSGTDTEEEGFLPYIEERKTTR